MCISWNMWVFNTGRGAQMSWFFMGKRWELGNIRLTSSKCQEEITWNKVFYYHHNPHDGNLRLWRIPAWRRFLQFIPFTIYNLPFPQSPLCHTTFTFCYARLWTEIKMWLLFLLSFFPLLDSSCHSKTTGNAFPEVTFLLYSTSPAGKQLLCLLSCTGHCPDCCQIPRKSVFSEIEQVNRQNPAPLLAAEEVEACLKFYRNILHWNFNLV